MGSNGAEQHADTDQLLPQRATRQEDRYLFTLPLPAAGHELCLASTLRLLLMPCQPSAEYVRNVSTAYPTVCGPCCGPEGEARTPASRPGKDRSDAPHTR